MLRKVTFQFLLSAVFIATMYCPTMYSSPRPLTRSEVLALVAGNALPENVASEISLFGISFTPDAGYVSLLNAAGANPKVITALSTATRVEPQTVESPADIEFLRQLSRAGKARLAKNYELAASELSAALNDKSHKAAAGYVMGSILVDAEQIPAALAVYQEVLAVDPDFPEVHTRLSFTYLNSGDPEEALRQTKAALERNPRNPVAHLNAAISYEKLNNLDAAKSELQLSLQYKPDYAIVLSEYGTLLFSQSDFEGAIAQYKKSLQIKPDNPNVLFNLGLAYYKKGDYDSAIREYREALRLDPNRGDARQNLAGLLVHKDPAAAVVEFRKWAAMYPDFELCHVCLGNSLLGIDRLDDAEQEYRTALKLNPESPEARYGLGLVFETKKQNTVALVEYRRAVKLSDEFAPAHIGIGRVLLDKKDFAGAAAELKRAEDLDPTDWRTYDYAGQALEGSGDHQAAIAEFKQALVIAPKEIQARLNLAQALEKSSDWVAALQNYHQATLDEPPVQLNVSQWNYDPEGKYANAKIRFQKYLADLRAAGKGADADALESALRDQEASTGLDSKYHDALLAIQAALKDRKFEEAEGLAKNAIAIAEKIQPEDGRLAEAVSILGNVYLWRMENKKAEETFQRQLLLIEKLNGPQSPLISQALQNLAITALAQKDYATSEAIFNRMYDLNEKAYGENSNATAEALRGLAHTYRMKQDYAKSEATLLRVVAIYKFLYGENDFRMAIPLTSLCNVYDLWGKTDKAQPCHAQLQAFAPQQMGQATNPQ